MITAPDSTTAGPQLSSQQLSGGAKENCRDGTSCGHDNHDNHDIDNKLECEHGECGPGVTQPGEHGGPGVTKCPGYFGQWPQHLVGAIVCPVTKCDMSPGTEPMCLVSGPARNVAREKCGPGQRCGDTEAASQEKNEDTSGEDSLTGEKGIR